MGTLRFFEEVVSFKIRRTFGFADYSSAIHCIAYGGDTTPTHPANRDCKSAAATARPDTANADAAVRPPPEKQCFPLWQRNPTVRRPVFLRSRHRTGVAHESPRHDKTIWSPTFRMFGPSETSGNEPNKKIDCRSERIAPAAPITLQNKIRLYAVRPEATPCDAS